jgi:NADH dehydrogenase FAD-containing subunit
MSHANGTNGAISGTNGTALPERVIKTDLHQFANRRATDGPYADNLELDVLIVGAGFSGTYLLYEMRDTRRLSTTLVSVLVEHGEPLSPRFSGPRRGEMISDKIKGDGIATPALV